MTKALPVCLEQFEVLYRELLPASVEAMSTVYDAGVVFTDPVHRIAGLPALQEYTRQLLVNVRECRFECHRWIIDGDDALVQWVMHLRHPGLRGGTAIAVNGVSRLHINSDGRIDEHEDFYDLGAMVYENIPLLGAAVRSVKRRLGAAA